MSVFPSTPTSDWHYVENRPKSEQFSKRRRLSTSSDSSQYEPVMIGVCQTERLIRRRMLSSMGDITELDEEEEEHDESPISSPEKMLNSLILTSPDLSRDSFTTDDRTPLDLPVPQLCDYLDEMNDFSLSRPSDESATTAPFPVTPVVAATVSSTIPEPLGPATLSLYLGVEASQTQGTSLSSPGSQILSSQVRSRRASFAGEMGDSTPEHVALVHRHRSFPQNTMNALMDDEIYHLAVKSIFDRGVKLVVLDFDLTITDVHANLWPHGAHALAQKVRPFVKPLICGLLDQPIYVAVVTMNNDLALVKQTMDLVIPAPFNEDIAVRCSGGDWERCRWFDIPSSNSGKLQHTASAYEELVLKNHMLGRTMVGEQPLNAVEWDKILLIDDNRDHCNLMWKQKGHAIHFETAVEDPSKTLLKTLVEKFTIPPAFHSQAGHSDHHALSTPVRRAVDALGINMIGDRTPM